MHLRMYQCIIDDSTTTSSAMSKAKINSHSLHQLLSIRKTLCGVHQWGHLQAIVSIAMRPNVATGPDEILSILLKGCVAMISKPLALFNHSVSDRKSLQIGSSRIFSYS